MTLRSYLTVMAVMTIICWSVWTFLFFAVNPEITNWIGLFLFYAALFLALVGTTALAGFIVRFIALKQELVFKLVKEAFRQSFLFSTLIIASLILLSRNLFSWLNLFFLVAAISILEFFLISYSKNN